jgi:hypothetical protein
VTGGWACRHRAQATIELVLLLPALLLGLFVIIGTGLAARADAEVAAVAVEAARAGALVPSASQVEPAARERAQLLAESYQLDKGRLRVLVDPSEFRRGGQVRVRVQYDLPLNGIPLVGWGTLPLEHDAIEPVDAFRSLR